MKISIIQTRIILLLLCTFYITGSQALDETETENRLYPIPDHGELVLDVPAHWEVTYVELGKQKPPLITFYNKDETQQEIFQLNVSIMWDDGFKRDITADDYIREIVKKSGEELLQISRESTLEIEELGNADNHGYYFKLSDANERPGEYAYLTQGALNTGNIVIIFSLFTHTRDAREIGEALQMLKNARQRFQPHV